MTALPEESHSEHQITIELDASFYTDEEKELFRKVKYMAENARRYIDDRDTKCRNAANIADMAAFHAIDQTGFFRDHRRSRARKNQLDGVVKAIEAMLDGGKLCSNEILADLNLLITKLRP